MKSVVASLSAVFLVAYAVPASASEPAFALRGTVEVAPASTTATHAEVKPATAVRKVRIVLASPYGN